MLTLENRAFLAAWIACATLAFTAVRSGAADDNAAKEMESKLIAVLKSDAQPGDKALACKQLALCGTRDAVPALVPFLADEHMAAWARIALEAIPDPAVDDALRESLGKLQGRCLIGAINSLAVRRDAKAVEPLAAKLKDSDVEVASAAAVALGRLGGDAAKKALQDALASAAPAVRSAAAEGCILCAEQILAAGKADEAIAVYDLVRGRTDVPQQRVREATRGAILARGAAGAPLLAELLQSADKEAFRLALTVAREMPCKEASNVLTSEFSKTSPERQSLLLLALGDRGDAAALSAIVHTAKSAPDSVKIMAAKVLTQVRDASRVSLLLELAVDANPAVAKAAIESLADLSGDDVDADIAARLPKAQGPVRLVLLQLVGDRVMTQLIPEVIKAAADPDLQVRLQALSTLGYAVEFKDLSILIDRVVVAPENAEETRAAKEALKVACVRMPDTEACAASLVAAMAKAKVSAKVDLLEVLTALGGKKALETVAATTSDPNTELQDAGSRLLGAWMTLDAAPAILNLAKTATDEKYQTRAVRGYIRLARQFPMSDAERVKMCRTALEIAKRDDERRLVLGVLTHRPSQEAAMLAAEMADIASLKADAGKAALAILQKVGGSPQQIEQILAHLGRPPVKVEIVKAEYGANGNVKDVTDAVRQGVCDLPLLALKGSRYNEAFGGDPAPGVRKELKIEYRLDGKSGKATFAEDAAVFLPTP